MQRRQDDGRQVLPSFLGYNRNSLQTTKIPILSGWACRRRDATEQGKSRSNSAILNTARSAWNLKEERDPWTAEEDVTANGVTSPASPSSLVVI